MVKHSMRMRASVDPSPFSGPRAVRAAEERRHAIERRAFQLAQERNFEPGHELADWLQAEAEYDSSFYGRSF